MTRLRPVLAIARVAVLRLFRDRATLFFVFLFPLLVVLLVGAQFGGSFELRLGIVAEDVGPAGEQLVDDLSALEDVVVHRYPDGDALLDAVARGQANGGLAIPAGYDDALRARDAVVLEFFGRPDTLAPALQSAVLPVVARTATLVSLADLVELATGTPFPEAYAQAQVAFELLPATDLRRTEVGSSGLAAEFEGLGRFDLGASQQLNLFVFITALTNATALIQSREFGVTRRLLAHPVTARGILLGELVGRLGVSLVQGISIVVGTRLLFGVDWGSLPATGTVLVVYALVSAGAGLLLGSLARTQNQAGAVGIGLALGLGALGGSMAPLEVFPEAMQQVARITPHAWAYEAYAEIIRRGGGIVDVLPQIGVLAAMAAGTVGLGGWALGRTLRAASS